MVDKVKFWGQKDRPGAENGGQNRGAYLLTLKEGVPPPGTAWSRPKHTNYHILMVQS